MKNVGWMSTGAAAWMIVSALAACSGDSGGDEGGENTLVACGDGADNDSDGFVDCADQDCSVFAACVGGADAGEDTSNPGEDADPGTDAGPGEDAEPGEDVDPGTDTDPGEDVDPGEDTSPEADVDVTDDTEVIPDVVEGNPCPDFEWCIVASISVTSNLDDVNGQATTNTLLPLIGETIEVIFSFNIVNVSDGPMMPDQPLRRTLLTSPVEVSTLNVGPNVWAEQIQPALQGGTTQIDLETQPPGVNGGIRVLISGLPLPGESFTLEAAAGGIPYTYDDRGYPILMPIAGIEDRIYVRRFTDLLTPSENMTDFAEGTMQWTLHQGIVP